MVKSISTKAPVLPPVAAPVKKDEWSNGQVALLAAVSIVAGTALAFYGTGFARSVYNSNIGADLRQANSEGFRFVKGAVLYVTGGVATAAAAAQAGAVKGAKATVNAVKAVPGQVHAGYTSAKTSAYDGAMVVGGYATTAGNAVVAAGKFGVEKTKAAATVVTTAIHAGLTELFGTRPLNNATCLTTATNDTLKQSFIVGNNCDKQFSLYDAVKFW